MDVLVTSMRPSGPGGSARKDRPGNGGQLREPQERVVVAGAIKTNTTAAANRGIHSSVAVVHASHRSSVILPSRPPALSSSRSVGGVVRASAGVDFQTPVKGRNTTDGNHEERGTATPTTAVTPITASSSSARGVTSLPLPNCSLPALSPSSLNVRMVPHINRLPPTDPLHSYTAVEDDDVPRGDHTCSSSSSSDLDDVDYGSSPHCHGGGVASFFENEPVMVVVGAQDVLRPNTLRRSSAADVHEDDDDVGDDVGRHPRPAAGSAVMRLRNYAFPTSPSTTSPTPRDEEQDAPVTRPEEEAVPNSRYPVEIQMSPPPLTSFGKPTEMAPPKRRNVPLPFEESQSLPKASTAPPSPQHHKYLQHQQQQQQPTSPPAGEDGDGKRVSENDDLHLTAAMMAQLLVPAAESRKPSDTLPPGSTVVETESTTRRGTEAVRPRTSAAYFLEQRLGQNRQSRGVLSRDSGLAALHAPFSHEIKSLDAGDLTAPSTREQRTFSEIVTDVIKKKVSSVKSFRRRLTSVNTTGSVVGMAQKQSSSAFVDDVPGSPLAREPFGGGFGDSMKTSVRRASVNDDAAGSPLAAFRGKRNRRPSMATLRAMEYEPTKEEAGDELDDDDPLEIISDDDWEGVTGEDVASGPTKSSPHESLTTAVHAGDPATARNDENGTRTVTFLAERRAGGIKGGGADDPLMQLIKDPLPAPLQTPASGSPALSVASQDAGFSGGDFGISPRNTKEGNNGRHTPRASLAGAAQPHLLRVDLVCSRTLDTAVDQTALELLHHNMRVLDICENPREMRQLSLWRHILVCGGSSLRCIGVVCMLFVVVVCVVLFPILHANGRL